MLLMGRYEKTVLRHIIILFIVLLLPVSITSAFAIGGAVVEGVTRSSLSNNINGLSSAITMTKGSRNPLGDAINDVRKFGAIPNDDLDDTVALQTAINSGDNVYISGGVYLARSLRLANTRLYGPGTIKWQVDANESLLVISGESEIDGLVFDGNAKNQTLNHVAITVVGAVSPVIKNSVFTNFRYKVIQTDVANSPYGKLLSNTFIDNGGVTSCSQIEIRSPYWQVSNNSFINIGDGHSVRVGLLNGDATTVPVVGTIISNNTFKNTQHVAVTLELYAQQTLITGNLFAATEAAIKAETYGKTVFDINIIGNTFKDTRIKTSLNLTVPQVNFSGNILKNIPGAVDLGDNASCSGNILNNVGSAVDLLPSIRQISKFSGLTVSGNTILNAPYRGVEVAGSKAIISGNRFKSIAGTAVRIAGDGAVVSDNLIDQAVEGISFISSAGSFTVTGNSIVNVRGKALSFVDNAASENSYVSDNVGVGNYSATRMVSGGSISIPVWANDIKLDTEPVKTSNILETINGGKTGQIIILRSSSVSRVITIKGSAGNISLEGDFSLDSPADTLALFYSGPLIGWLELSRSSY